MSAGVANQIGPYMYANGAKATKTFGTRTFVVLIAGAYNAGIIGSEHNGIAVLDEDFGNIVLDQHIRISSGYLGPSREQKAEFDRVMAMSWDEFRSFMHSHPRYRQGTVPDIGKKQPLDIAKPADREIFPTSSPLRKEDSPYLAPLTRRREIIQFLVNHEFHRVDGPHSPFALSWNIKVGGFDSSGKHEGFTPDTQFDERWNNYVSTNDALFWEEATDAISVYTGGDYTMYEGNPSGSFKFATTGRSGGHMILTEFYGSKDVRWAHQKDAEFWFDELKDDDLVALYRLIDQLDVDLKHPEREMEYRYAFHRQQMEEQWSSEARPAVA